MTDDYLERLESEVGELRAMLVPLESGIIRIGAPGEQPAKTEARIADLKRRISEIQAILDRRRPQRG